MKRAVVVLSLLVVPHVHAAIRGIAFSGDGSGVENARVAVYRLEGRAEERERVVAGRAREALGTATTDAKGAFAIEARFDGVVAVEVSREGFAPWRTVMLAGGGDVSADLQPAAPRTGRVTAGGKPVPDALVLAGDESGLLWTGRTDDKGSFTIPDPKSWAPVLLVIHPDHSRLVAFVSKYPSLELPLSAGASVRGKVLGSDRRPAAKAKLFSSGWPAGTTADDGTFVIAHLSDDAKTIAAFSESEHGVARRSGAGEIVIELQPSHTITGSVRDPKQVPLAGARVSASPESGEVSWDDARSAVSDAKGNYRIEHCDGKGYYVSAEAGDLDFDAGRTSLKSVRLARVDLTAKQQTYIEGIVVDERKHPVAGAYVRVMPDALPLFYARIEVQSALATSGADGRFRIPSGETPTYGTQKARIEAIHPRYAAAKAEIKQGGKPVTITLRDGIEVRGTVADKDGKAVSGAGVILLEDPLAAASVPLDGVLSSGNAKPFVESDAEGKFTLHLNDAVHDLTVWKEGFASFHLGDLKPAAGQKPIAVVLDRGAEIRGRVVRKKGNAPHGGLIDVQSDAGAYRTADVNDDGSFTVTSLVPGTYTLQYTNEKGLREGSKTVKAPAEDVVLELSPLGEIRGRVVDKDSGGKIAQFSIQAMTSEGETSEDQYVDTDAFTLAVTPGSKSVTARAEGYIAETQQVLVDEDKPSTVTFALARGRVLTGRVTTETGLPVAGANIAFDTEDYRTAAGAESGADGEFELAGVPREAVTIKIEKQGFVPREVEVASDAGQHLSIVLSSGLKASGRVQTSAGDPVEGVEVWAFSAATSGTPQNVKSAADGTFAMEGLSAGLYAFRASHRELGTAQVENVDPSAAPIVLTFPPSKGTGTVHGTIEGFAGKQGLFGVVYGGEGIQTIIRRDGTYRIENARAGEVELRAVAMSGETQISTPAVSATIVANQDIEVNLAFRSDLVLRGTVTENGQPAAGRSVSFASAGGSWRTKTDEHGAYEIATLEPGRYSVSVQTSRQASYMTEYQMSGSATFDIAIDFAVLQGRVVDEAGVPQAVVKIDVKIDVKSGGRDAEQTTMTDGAGNFSLGVTQAPAYVVSASKKGYATAVQPVDNTRTPLVLTLVRSAGLRVRLLDARTSVNLGGYVVATNEAGLLAGRVTDAEKDGSFLVPLARGSYRVSVSAYGYASQSVRVTVPYDGEVRLGLTPGGTLVVRADRSSGELVKLVAPNGEEYVRCECNGIAEIRLTGSTTTIDHVAPGRYTMQVLDGQGRIKSSYPVAIEEGGTTVADIHVPG